MSEGLVFKKSSSEEGKSEEKVKTKAKKTSYIKGAHGSGASKMKAEFRRKRTTRHKHK